MIAYKAFNRDLTCRGFQYKEGETFEHLGDFTICNSGFHFCKELCLTLDYYPADILINNRYAEVEILGDVKFEDTTKHKGCTNKIKIVRVIPDEEILKLFDKKNNTGDWNSGNSNSGNRNSGNSNSGDMNSGYRNSGYRNSGYRNSGDWNSGNSNSGDRNSGYRNSGYRNSGYRNSGNSNSGDSNSGDSNSGDSNSGDSNSGDSNSGDSNSGDRNSGNSNSGDRNSGDWNSVNNESGMFNSKQLKTIRVFNKSCTIKRWENANKPNFLYFDLIIGKTYKESFQESFKSASDDDIKLLKKLPNFDKKVFFEISGIKIK